MHGSAGWLILIAIAVGILLTALIAGSMLRRDQLDDAPALSPDELVEQAPWSRLDAACLKCDCVWVKRIGSGVVKVGDPVQCPACGAEGVVTKP